MAINQADNWQKKPAARPEYSDVLRQQRQTQVRENSKQAAQTMHQLQAAKVAEGARAPHAPDGAAKQTAPAAREVPQTVQKARGEVQAEVARHDIRASREFLENRKSAADLRQLETKSPSAKGAESATRAAVTEKGAAVETHIAKQTAGELAPELARTPAEIAARQAAMQTAARLAARAGERQRTRDEGRGTRDETARGTKDETTRTPNSELRTPGIVAQVAQTIKPQEVATKDEGRGTKDDDSETGEKKEGGEAKRSGGVYAKTTNAGGELNALLGGFAGGSENEGQGESEPSAVVAVTTNDGLPELDPHTHIYNEYDESHPGAETVMRKARVLYGMVLKQKLVEIAEFDRDLEFKLKGLSERVVGDLKGEITLAHFHKSVYGGLIG